MVPKEDFEIEVFSNRLRSKWYKFNNIMNETDWHSIYKWAKRKRLWVSKWFPDFCIILKRRALLFIEMKRQRPIGKTWKILKSPSSISIEQIEWIEAINNCNNVEARICYWAEQAKKIIKELEKK